MRIRMWFEDRWFLYVSICMSSFGFAVPQFQEIHFGLVLGRCCFQLEMYGNHIKWNREERYVACCRPGTQAVTFLALELLGTQRFEETAV